MKNKVIILVLMISFTVSGQLMASNKKANRYFELFKYAKAIPLYKKAAQSDDQNIKAEATARLADCYRLTNNIQEARSWYSKAIETANADPLNYYYLGMAYRSLGSYDEAKAAFLRFSELKPDDERGKLLAGYCDKIKSLGTLSDSVIIKNAELLNSKFSDFCPVYYKKGLIFASDRKDELLDERTFDWTNYGYLDLYYSEPSYYQDFWTQMSYPEIMSHLFNQTYHDGPVCFSTDQNTVYVTRTLKTKTPRNKDNIRTNLLQIFSASLADPKSVKYESFAYNRQTYSSGHPALSKDGKKLIFSSDMPGGYGESDLYLTEMVDGKWSQPLNLGAVINTFGSEVFPFWFNDTTLYFSSDGHVSYGGLDIFESVWKDGKWSAPENLMQPINSSYDDFGLVFREDRKEGFFSSNRPGGKGADDIYAIHHYTGTHVTPPTKPEEGKSWVSPYFACGFVKDKTTLQPIGNATVFVLNTLTSKVLVLRSDSTGWYKTPVEKDVLFVAKALQSGYFDGCTSFRFSVADSLHCISVPQDLLLQKYGLDQIFKLDNIYYDLDKWNIRNDAYPVLDQLIGTMEHNPISIELSSHTDSRANDEYNMELSFKRAESAVRYIVMNGINPARITAKGYGETMPVNGCINGVPCTEAEHQTNRRTEFRITTINSGKDDKNEFDTSPFLTGDVIPVQLLEPDFFKGCFSKEITAMPVKPEVKTESKEEIKTAVFYPVVKQVFTESIVSEPVAVGDTYFTVQIYAIMESTGQKVPDFKGEEPVISKVIGGITKYYVGKYSGYKSAQSVKTRLQNKFPGAFIVAFKDGNIVPVNELKELLK
jgi:outer membrane protein OmpA-like peptidoglycan-associated protein/tetratricopeptide (TPR) repeat protein